MEENDWRILVARVQNGNAEIAYGHHRLVALREEYGPDETVDLIIRSLPDDAMLQIMARENMEEWGTSASAEHETIRAVVEAFADGKIELDPPDAQTQARYIRHTPLFTPGDDQRARADRPYTIPPASWPSSWAGPSPVASRLRFRLIL